MTYSEHITYSEWLTEPENFVAEHTEYTWCYTCGKVLYDRPACDRPHATIEKAVAASKRYKADAKAIFDGYGEPVKLEILRTRTGYYTVNEHGREMKFGAIVSEDVLVKPV